MLTDRTELTPPPESEVRERPFRFGVVAGGPPVVARWTSLARRVEAAGFDTLLVPDTLDGAFPSGSPSGE